MKNDSYNYSAFEGSPTEFLDFAKHGPKVTMRAPSFALEDVASGSVIQMKDLWAAGIVVMEFGSFT
jgi:hypothetical protein